jgi:hypothetical protein
MKTIALIGFYILFCLPSIAQADSATVILKNISNQKIKTFMIGFDNQIVGASNLKPGDSTICKVHLTGNVNNGRVYAKTKKNVYNIQPMDYPDQVSKEILKKGTYLFLIGIKNEEGGYLDIEVKKVK